MRSPKPARVDISEPVYDDCTLEMIDGYETEELIAALAAYCRNLEKQVVGLRCRINKLTPSDRHIPFPEPQSDLYETFHHYAAYPKFKKILKKLD